MLQSDATRSYKRLLPSTTMKFGGFVDNVTDRGAYVDLDVVGYSNAFLRNVELPASVFPELSTNAKNGSYVYDSTNTTSKERTLLENILGDIITSLNSKYLELILLEKLYVKVNLVLIFHLNTNIRTQVMKMMLVQGILVKKICFI